MMSSNAMMPTHMHMPVLWVSSGIFSAHAVSCAAATGFLGSLLATFPHGIWSRLTVAVSVRAAACVRESDSAACGHLITPFASRSC